MSTEIFHNSTRPFDAEFMAEKLFAVAGYSEMQANIKTGMRLPSSVKIPTAYMHLCAPKIFHKGSKTNADNSAAAKILPPNPLEQYIAAKIVAIENRQYNISKNEAAVPEFFRKASAYRNPEKPISIINIAFPIGW